MAFLAHKTTIYNKITLKLVNIIIKVFVLMFNNKVMCCIIILILKVGLVAVQYTLNRKITMINQNLSILLLGYTQEVSS